MRSWGIWLIILGVLAFVYPMFGYQLKILSFLDDEGYTIAAIVLIIAGVILTILSFALTRKAGIVPGSSVSTSDTTGSGGRSAAGTGDGSGN